MTIKKQLSESDIKAKFITPALLKAGWDEQTQIRREVFFTDGRILLKAILPSEANANKPIIFFTTNPISPLPLLKRKTINYHLIQVFNKP